jgi:hypothetical protein
MIIPLIEPTSTRYIHVNPVTNRVHLLVPFVGGQDISTDNTCQTNVETNAFFGGGGFNELESYKSVLEFHISLLDVGDAIRTMKEARLAQINIYLDAVRSLREGYQDTVNAFLAKPSNLYSIQLRPREQDSYGNVVNPVFTINRSNNIITGTSLSPLYNKMHEVFPTLTLGKSDPRTQLMTATLNALPENAVFEDIQRVLSEQCQALFKSPVDFQSSRTNQTVDKTYIDELMALGDDAASEEYIEGLLGVCAPNLWTTLEGSPFYLGIYHGDESKQAESLSMMTQFYLGVLNVHCRAQGISDKNFGQILDGSATLSQALVDAVSQALRNRDDVESTAVAFFNAHQQAFSLSQALTPADKDAIQEKFEITYRTVTATKENPHMDDFMILDTEARGKRDIFFTQKGLICTDFANIAPTTGPNHAYFDEIRQEASMHPDVMRPQDEAVITVDLEPEALMDKLADIQWDKLPKEVADACRALPAFQIRQFPDDVAKGKQDEAEALLNASDDKQSLLKTPAKFTDYSGRTFNCTAYEYAYWAKDTHMRRMLESHMDDATKIYLLDKIDEMERSGLDYQQHGVDYKNPHYDVSFVLKALSTDEFRELKTMVGQNVDKINNATADNYATLTFTATEYEQLKKELKQQANVWNWMLSCLGSFQGLCYLTYPAFFIASFFITPPANAIANKLAFDFKSLITALDTYVTNYDSWDYHQQDAAWLDVGKAQRDVPVHIANEYCNPYRSFDPCPEFNEASLPRSLSFCNYTSHPSVTWFSLDSSASGLGFDFGLLRGLGGGRHAWGATRRWSSGARVAALDRAGVSRLDEVRTADLTRSREILNVEAPNHGLQS